VEVQLAAAVVYWHLPALALFVHVAEALQAATGSTLVPGGKCASCGKPAVP
jgi:hypothetical protein